MNSAGPLLNVGGLGRCNRLGRSRTKGAQTAADSANHMEKLAFPLTGRVAARGHLASGARRRKGAERRRSRSEGRERSGPLAAPGPKGSRKGDSNNTSRYNKTARNNKNSKSHETLRNGNTFIAQRIFIVCESIPCRIRNLSGGSLVSEQSKESWNGRSSRDRKSVV